MKFKTECLKHQLEEFNKYKDKNYFAMFHEMGCGKTKLAIDLLRYKCYNHKRVLKTLIITPKIAMQNWKEEFKLHSSLVDYVEILKGTRAKKISLLDDSTKKIFLINFESVKSLYAELYTKWDCIIIDESQRIKNPRAISTKLILNISKSALYRYILSGTPILNNPLDIFTQAKFLDKGKTYGVSYTAFRVSFFEDKNAWMKQTGRKHFPKFELKADKVDEYKKLLLTFSSIIKKEDCLDLPPKVYITYKLEMGKEQKKAYDEMFKDLITFISANSDLASVASTAAVKVIRLRQISSGFMKIDDSNKLAIFKDNPKIKAVKEALEDLTQENKVIIWICFRQDARTLIEELKKYNPAVIYGENSGQHEENKLKFKNDASCRVLIAHPKSAGLAINLVHASYSIYYSQGFELEYRMQSEDRTHRKGAEIHEKITYLDYVYPNTVDEIILKSLKNKKNLASSLVQQVKEIINTKGGE